MTENQQNENMKPDHRLVGAGLHFKDEDGCVRNQAEILAVIPSNCNAAGDLALIQYFNWFSGAPSTQRLIPLIELASTERWVFYSTVAEMNDHYENVDEHQNEFIRSRLAKEPTLGGAGLEVSSL